MRSAIFVLLLTLSFLLPLAAHSPSATWLIRPDSVSVSNNNEWILEDFVDDLTDEEQIDWCERQVQLSQQPIDLNRATYEELRQLPMLSEYQIHQLRHYRDERGGELLSPFDLKWIPGWDATLIEQLLPWITLRPLSSQSTTPVFRSAVYSYFSSPLIHPTPRAASDSPPTHQPGSPLKSRMGVTLEQKRHWRAGLHYQKATGEPWLLPASMQPLHLRYALEWEHPCPYVRRLIIGYMAGQWGQGLLLSSSVWGRSSWMVQSRGGSLPLPSLSPSLRSSYGMTQDRALHGIAIAGGTPRWGYEAFYSYMHHDGIILDEGGRAAQMTVSNTPYSTESRLASHGVIPMHTLGARLHYQWRLMGLSLQTLYSHWGDYALTYLPHYHHLKGLQPLWSHHALSSLAYQWHTRDQRIELSGEVALEHERGGFGTLHQIRYHTRKQALWAMILYHLDATYTSYYGRAATHASALGREQGMSLMYQTRLGSLGRIQSLFTLYRALPLGGQNQEYNEAQTSSGWKAEGRANIRLSSRWSNEWRVQISHSSIIPLRGALHARTRYRTPLLEMVATAVWMEVRCMNGKKQRGQSYSLRVILPTLWPPAKLSLQLGGGYYKHPSRLVAATHALPMTRYDYRLLRRLGEGVAASLHLTATIAPNWKIETAYRTEQPIGDRTQSQDEPNNRCSLTLSHNF